MRGVSPMFCWFFFGHRNSASSVRAETPFHCEPFTEIMERRQALLSRPGVRRHYPLARTVALCLHRARCVTDKRRHTHTHRHIDTVNSKRSGGTQSHGSRPHLRSKEERQHDQPSPSHPSGHPTRHAPRPLPPFPLAVPGDRTEQVAAAVRVTAWKRGRMTTTTANWGTEWKKQASKRADEFPGKTRDKKRSGIRIRMDAHPARAAWRGHNNAASAGSVRH